MKTYNYEENKYVEACEEEVNRVFPKRLLKENGYEVWKYSYLMNNILEEGEDLVGVKFGEINLIFIFSKYKGRLEWAPYLDRISLLVHDLDNDFDYVLINQSLSPEEVIQFMKEYEK